MEYGTLNYVRLTQLFLFFPGYLRIFCNMSMLIDTLKVDSVEEVLEQNRLTNVVAYVGNLSKTLNKYFAASNRFNCNISYISIVGKLIVWHSRRYRTRFNIFNIVKKTKLIKAKFQSLEISQLSKERRYKINITSTESSFLAVYFYCREFINLKDVSWK